LIYKKKYLLYIRTDKSTEKSRRDSMFYILIGILVVAIADVVVAVVSRKNDD
jgi:hypothetical protein